MSEQSAEDVEQLSISDLDLKNQALLSSSLTQVHNDLITTLTFYARHATDSPVESTHQIRKKLKFFRAFVKLLKPFHSDDYFKRTNIVLRDFGRLFSGLRDAHVRAIMLEEFLNQPDLNTSKSILLELDELNQNEINQLETELFEPENIFLNFANDLEQNDLLENYSIIGNPDPKVLWDSLSLSFEKSALTYELAFESEDAELLHEWRKRLKDVQYQFEMLLKNLSAAQTQIYTSVAILCDHLGRSNDLDMIYHWLEAVQPDNQKPSESGLRPYVSNLIDNLHTKIKGLGMDIYSKSHF